MTTKKKAAANKPAGKKAAAKKPAGKKAAGKSELDDTYNTFGEHTGATITSKTGILKGESE